MNKRKIIEEEEEFVRYRSIKYFIFTGGKTGGSTLHESLKNSLHVHCDRDLWNKDSKLEKYNIGIKDLIDYTYNKNKKKVFVISSYRDPISRTISSFFENYEFNVRKKNATLKEQLAVFNDNFFVQYEEYHPCLNKQDLFGLDIYKKPFDTEKGYTLYENDTIKLLLLKFDIINKWKDIIHLYLDEDSKRDFTYKQSNFSPEKWYSSTYKIFKNNFYTTNHLLNLKILNNSPLLDYIYTPQQRAALVSIWRSYCLKSSSKYVSLPDSWNFKSYLALNPDLVSNGITIEKNAIFHWIYFGSREKRRYE